MTDQDSVMNEADHHSDKVFFWQECGAYPAPTTSTDGSFKGIAMGMAKGVMVTGIIAFGTPTLGTEAVATEMVRKFRILPAGKVQAEAANDVEADISEKYLRLREEMLRAGIPMLDDEQIREEIRSRKGIKPGMEG